MEITLEAIISLVGLFLGGGCGAFFTWRYQKKKAKAEAATAEAEAEKAFVEVIQEMREMYKSDREEQKAYISELKEDRQHLRTERDDLRKRQDDLEGIVRKLRKDVEKNSRLVKEMFPLLCGRTGCQHRQPATLSESVEVNDISEDVSKPIE